MFKPVLDLIGQRFGRLIVQTRSTATFSDPKHVRWICLCDCGAVATVRAAVLRRGCTRSCGCLKREVIARGTTTTHGATHTPEYRAWAGLINRCTNPNNAQYANYGKRGITVVPEWRNDFQAFLTCVGLRPSAQHSIDRFPDNNGNYAPGNVRWATKQEQSISRRRRVKRHAAHSSPVVREHSIEPHPITSCAAAARARAEWSC
jgi:hypothetical protein